MQRLGKVEDWNDERGYGFIAPLQTSEGGGKTFFHIRDYQQHLANIELATRNGVLDSAR